MLKQRITALLNAIATSVNDLRSWVIDEINSVYNSINDVINSIPTDNSELDNGAGYLKEINWEEVQEKPFRFKPLQHTHQLNQSALGAWVCLTTETDNLYAGCIEKNTKLFVNDTLIGTYDDPTQVTLNLVAGDILTTNNKPIGISSERQARIASLNLVGSVFGFFSNRNSPHTVFLFSPFGNAEVEYYYAGYKDTDIPTSTISIQQGEIVSFLTPEASEGHHRIYSSTPILVTKESAAGAGSDAMQVPPMSDEMLLKSSPTGTGFDKSTTSFNSDGNYFWSPNGLLYTQSIADGAGNNLESGLPVNSLGDTYIIPHVIREYGIVSLESGTINIYYWDAVAKGWVFYKSHESNGTKESPFVHQEGIDSGAISNPDLFPGSPVLVSGNINFYLRTNSRAAREYAVLGYRSSERVFAFTDYLSEIDWDEVDGKPVEFPPEAHTHPDLVARIGELEGLQLIANQTAQEITIQDYSGTVLSTISVAFLNNEGTTFFYNETSEELELRNDEGVILSSVPVSAFVSNLANAINLNSNTLTLRDTQGNIISSVNFQISNIGGLQNALDQKANDSTVIHKSGVETITDRKIIKTGGQVQLTLFSTSIGTLLDLVNSGGHVGIRFQQESGGNISNQFNLISYVENSVDFFAISKAYLPGGKQYLTINANTDEVDVVGDFKAKSVSIDGGKSHQVLMADGSVNESAISNYYQPYRQHVGRVGGSTDTGWKRLFHIKFDPTESNYRASKIAGFIYNENGNHHQSKTDVYKFQWIMRAGNGSSVSDTSTLYLQKNMPNLLRVVKNDVNDYELQIRSHLNHRYIGYDIREWGNSAGSLAYNILDSTEADPGTGAVGDTDVIIYNDIIDWDEIRNKPSYLHKITESIINPNDATVTNSNNSTSGITWEVITDPTVDNYPSSFGVVWSFRERNSKSNRSFDIYKDTNTNRFYLRGYNGTAGNGEANAFVEIFHSGNLNNISQLINDAGYITGVSWSEVTGKPTNLETTSGAQSKANTAEQNAKDYADSLTGSKPPVDDEYLDISELINDQSNQSQDYFYEVIDGSGFVGVDSGKVVVWLQADTLTGTKDDYVVIWQEVDQFVRRDDLGFGLNWNSNTQKVDWAQIEMSGSSTWRVLPMGNAEIISLGDPINNPNDPHLYINKQTGGGAFRFDAGEHNDGVDTTHSNITMNATEGGGGHFSMGISKNSTGKSITANLNSGKGIEVSDSVDGKGLVGSTDFSGVSDPLAYAQQSFVNNAMNPSASPWQNITLGGDATATSARVRKKGNVVALELIDYVKNTGSATIPTGFRPTSILYTANAMNNSSSTKDPVPLAITTGGEIVNVLSSTSADSIVMTIQYTIF